MKYEKTTAISPLWLVTHSTPARGDTSASSPCEPSSLSFDPCHQATKPDEEGSLVHFKAEAEDVEGQAEVKAG